MPCTSSVRKKSPSAAPYATTASISYFVSASKTGGPGTSMSVIDVPSSPGTEVAELRDGDVLPKLEPELLGVEGERLVLVVDPHRHMGELLQHRVLLRRFRSEATLDPAHAAVFSKRAVSGRAQAMSTQVGTRARVSAGG